MYSTANQIFSLTDEQRKALMQCLFLGARPSEVLLHTRYVVIEPNGELSLAAGATQDYTLLLQEGKNINPLGEIIEDEQIRVPLRVPRTEVLSSPFSASQERRIREIAAEVLRGAAESAEEAL